MALMLFAFISLMSVSISSFETTLPYKVTEPTLARLVFRQENPDLSVIDPELKNYIYVFTMEVLLKP